MGVTVSALVVQKICLSTVVYMLLPSSIAGRSTREVSPARATPRHPGAAVTRALFL